MNPSSERVPLPCPFCGAVGLDFTEGSTFRWIVASCSGCGASIGETRIQTLGQGTKEEWMADAQHDAIAAWNTRAALSTPHRAIQDLIKARDTFGWSPEVDEKINALRSLSTQPQQAGWMPIETAPKDGTEVIGWSEAEPTIARFVRWAYHLGRPIYKEAWATRRLIHTSHQPTHWMPLPPVPGQEGEQHE